MSADCGENTKAEWDYNAWNLKVDNIKSNSKCSLTFISNLSEEEYKEYIEAGIEYRRNTYRGKDITAYKDLNENDPMNLYKQINNCTFDDIYVGDYIVSETKDSKERPITWLIADLNNYLYTGAADNNLTRCHATIIPAKPLTYDQMNTTNTTDVVNPNLKITTSDTKQEMSSIGGYIGSKMKQEVLPSVLTNYVEKDFQSHILQYTKMYADQIDSTAVNRWGTLTKNSEGVVIGGTGASNNWHWYYSYIDLMSEVNVHGTIIASSSFIDVGSDNRQYAIFRLKPEFINSYGGDNFSYWLNTVADKSHFSTNYFEGVVGPSNASSTYGVRPRFLID